MKLKELVKGRTYRIKGESQYFQSKYGTSNPLFTFKGTDRELWGGSWFDVFDKGGPSAVTFKLRMCQDGLDVAWDDDVLYGTCRVPGAPAGWTELVIPDELEDIEAPATGHESGV